jgi:hypothetical protein
MHLKPLYHLRLRYLEGGLVDLSGPNSTESQHFFLAEGRCDGRIAGQFRGANHPLRRGDGTFLPDFQGLITTDDQALVYFDHRGYGRTYPAERRQIVAMGTHVSDDARYMWLNDSIAVAEGEVRTLADGSIELVMEWHEVIWEPITE